MINYLVLEWMTPHPIAVSGLCTVKEARQLMTEQRVRRLLVMDRGHLAGIVTLGDVRAAESQVHDLAVSRIMARNVLTVSPKTSIRDAANMMMLNKVGGLPVLDNGKVVGIITESDIFTMLVRELDRFVITQEATR